MECYICYDKESVSDKFVKDPCKCKGSNKIHTSCLKKLIEKNGSTCSICKQIFSLNKIKDYGSLDNSRHITKNIPIQTKEDYIFREDNRNYYFEDKDNVIHYTYIGDGTYRITYKHKRCCVIS